MKNINKSANIWDLSNDYGIGYDNNGNIFYFSKQDFELIKNYYWRVHKHKYVSTAIWNTETKKIKQIQLHRFLLHPNESQEVDHINHNPSDNRRENLRVVSTAQNQMNTVINKNNTSGIKGVNWDKGCNKWRVRISINGERLTLGYYNTLEEAAQARCDAELKYYGEYRYIKATQED